MFKYSAEYAENQALSGGVSAILRSGLLLKNMFLLLIWATGTMYMNFDKKHSPIVLENQTKVQNNAYTTGTMYMNFDQKHSPIVLENQTKVQNNAYTTGTMYMNFDKNILQLFLRIRLKWCRITLSSPERARFSAYSALYLNKFHRV